MTVVRVGDAAAAAAAEARSRLAGGRHVRVRIVDWQAVCRHAATLLDAHWLAVLELTEALDQRGRLTGADVTAITSGKTAGQRPIRSPRPGSADRPVAV